MRRIERQQALQEFIADHSHLYSGVAEVAAECVLEHWAQVKAIVEND